MSIKLSWATGYATLSRHARFNHVQLAIVRGMTDVIEFLLLYSLFFPSSSSFSLLLDRGYLRSKERERERDLLLVCIYFFDSSLAELSTHLHNVVERKNG